MEIHDPLRKARGNAIELYDTLVSEFGASSKEARMGRDALVALAKIYFAFVEMHYGHAVSPFAAQPIGIVYLRDYLQQLDANTAENAALDEGLRSDPFWEGKKK